MISCFTRRRGGGGRVVVVAASSCLMILMVILTTWWWSWGYHFFLLAGDSTSVVAERQEIKHSQLPAKKVVASKIPPVLSPRQLLEDVFPECLPNQSLFREVDHLSMPLFWLQWLKQTATTTIKNETNTTTLNSLLLRYAPSNSRQRPRYDHITCPVMKARYNCAKATTGSSHHHAFDYTFQWRWHPEDKWCDFQNLTDYMKGPASIIASRNVILQGNSYLRQVWEALVCGFRHQVTNLTLLSHGPPTSLAYITSRRGKLIQRQELGDFLPNQQDIVGCHGPSKRTPLAEYYDENVTIPPNIEACTDDMAMAEFQNGLRISFMFHPSRFHENALLEAYTKLDFPKKELDVMVWMDHDEKELRNRTAHAIWTFEDVVLFSLRQVQWNSLAYFYGADNPWITDPPDNHPCMPGVPDDEANILLFLLLLRDYENEKWGV